MKAISEHGHKNVYFKNSRQEAVSYLKETLRDNDVLLTLGAGDVWKVGEDFLEVLEKE